MLPCCIKPLKAHSNSLSPRLILRIQITDLGYPPPSQEKAGAGGTWGPGDESLESKPSSAFIRAHHSSRIDINSSQEKTAFHHACV